MTVRVVMLAMVLLFAQSPWAHAARVADVATPASTTQEVPCHEATGASHHTPTSTHNATHDSTPAPDSAHDCCEGAGCAGGCHCACSAAPVISAGQPIAPLALWLVRLVAAAPPGKAAERPPDLFRPPI